MNYQELAQQIEPIIKHAGEIVLSYYGNGVRSQEKTGKGIVTQADLASETYLIEALGRLMPEASFCAEESGCAGSGDYCWVIDPLDGTSNFFHGIPHFGISIALTHKEMPVFGAIYHPSMEEFFWATRGSGAWLNNKKIRVSNVQKIEDAFVGVSAPYRKHGEAHLSQAVKRGMDNAYAIRQMGAAALDCAYVACGRLDATFFEQLAWWDVAAGIILVQEAGGMVTDFAGLPLNREYKSFLAAGAPLYGQLQPLLASESRD